MRSRRDIGQLIAGLPVPDEIGAQRRSWQVVRAAFETREPVRWPSRRLRPLAALAALVALGAGAVSPPGRALIDTVRDAIGRERVSGVRDAEQAVFSLPSRGRLLVTARRGAWIVHPDGARRFLGRYTSASWSPRGLFVVATRRSELVAIDPKGNLRWTVPQRGTISQARWAPGDGYRVAYLSDENIRVVAGDGRNDHLFRRGRPPAVFTALGWRPRADHVLSSGDRRGRVRTYAVDPGTEIWRSRPTGRAVIELEWSRDGRRLLALDRTRVRVFTAGGRLLRTIRAAGPVLTAAFRPRGHAIALVTRQGPRSRVSLWDVDRRRLGERRLFTGPGWFTDLAWSPNGRWLLVGWRSADQWLFLDVRSPQRVKAFSNISRQFTPGGRPLRDFPDVSETGWCCSLR